MAGRLRNFPVALTGGLQDSRALPEPGDLEEVFNFQIYRGRFALRGPIKDFVTLLDDQGAPQEVTSVVAMVQHNFRVYMVSHSTNTNKVYLHSVATDGTGLTNHTTLWDNVTFPPMLTLVSFEGGTATSPVERLFIADFEQNLVTKFWDGSTVTTLQEDLSNVGTKGNVVFHLVTTFQFHVWGAGFYHEPDIFRPEMLRFSRPGLIPEDDIAGGDNPKEWHFNDHRSLGRRGEKIQAIDFAGSRMIVLKESSVHVVFGYDASSWATQELSSTVGCVGPYAATADGRGLVYWWSPDGPFASDGSEVQDIGEPIRGRLLELELDHEKTIAQYSHYDRLVYFAVAEKGEDHPSKYLAFDVDQTRWIEGEWLAGASTPVNIGAMGRVADHPNIFMAEADGGKVFEVGTADQGVGLDRGSHSYTSTLKTERFSPLGEGGLGYFRRVVFRVLHDQQFTGTIRVYVDDEQTQRFDNTDPNSPLVNQEISITTDDPDGTFRESLLEAKIAAHGTFVQVELEIQSQNASGTVMVESAEVHLLPLRVSAAREGATQ